MIGVLFQNMLERLQGSPWIVLFKGKLALTESCVLILRIVSQRLFGESFGVLMIAAKDVALRLEPPTFPGKRRPRATNSWRFPGRSARCRSDRPSGRLLVVRPPMGVGQ